nr:MAG TPA: hypothetical protein [Crassvirales sp.]
MIFIITLKSLVIPSREIAVVTRGILLMLVLILMIKILCNPLRIL